MSASINSAIVQATTEMVHQWGWFLAFGFVLVILGTLAVIRSFAATVASMLFFAWLLILGGVVEFVESFMVGHWTGFFLHLLAAILFIVTGCLLMSRPVISAEALTFVMSLFFLVGGLYEVIAASWAHVPGWGWQVCSGLISTLMGGFLLAQWPLSGLWAIGLFIGIDLLLSGFTWMALALNLHKM